MTVAVGGELEVATLPLGPIVTSPTPAQVSSQRWSTRSSEARGEELDKIDRDAECEPAAVSV